MSTDHTQKQSSEQQRRARALSLQEDKSPCDIPGYSVQRLLGCGAFGEVWIGVDQNTGRRVAIKFYTHRSGVDWTLLASEVEKLVCLAADRYVVQLLDVGWNAQPPYYVMDYIENGSLEDLLRKRGPLPAAEAAELFWEIATGLLHAHGKGVLHCDLKPANVLLDQDHKPRLADFGQSRLSSEQSPALGTLFYMAPEQADLKALPDARWDVYALGAIFHCMLTGEPPFRTQEAVRRIEDAGSLPERLARYRSVLRSLVPPGKHRRLAGVDRALTEIISRCLAVDLDERFPNVQAVLDALNAREEARLRRPLTLLGFVGPMLLLFIMVLFGLRGYDHAVKDSEYSISLRARESNDFAARFAARSIERELDQYFQVIRKEAESQELHRRFAVTAASEMVQQLNDPSKSAREIAALRTAFLIAPVRCSLNEYLEQRLSHYLDRSKSDPGEIKLSSMLAVDTHGRMLAAAYDDRNVDAPSIGWNYAYRTYFHGGPGDLSNFTQKDTPQDVKPIVDTHLSTAFLSTATRTWKVAVSTPIYHPDDPDLEVMGVLALTVNLGDFAYFRSNYRSDRFAVLIDGREGPNKCVILQHPLLDRLRREGVTPGSGSHPEACRVDAEQLRSIQFDKWHRYQDPMRGFPGGDTYGGDWIAAVAPVRVAESPPARQDMIVLVQERYADATAPVQELGNRLKSEGLWALSGMIGVLLVLWYIVLRMLEEPRALRRRAAHTPTPPTPRHELTTVTTSLAAQRPESQ